MLQYILEMVLFQLAFLLVYDLFLRKETFFQWNRVYLLGTFALSMVLPWVKIEALATTVPQELTIYSIVVWNLEAVTLGSGEEGSFLQGFPWPLAVLILGSVFMAIWFAIKLYKVQRLRTLGKVHYLPNFVKVVVPNSRVAFSFFRQLFLGADIKKEDEPQIVAHELVHIKQWHTLDLLFFEMMRIVIWFNPAVYLYQHRIAELHEFIADSAAGKVQKMNHYQVLLSQLFQSNGVSFINSFYKSSLIKKRIVMLTKKKSNQVLKFKYLLMLPLLFGILTYTSCGSESPNGEANVVTLKKEVKGHPFSEVDQAPIFPGCENASDSRECFQQKMQRHIKKHFRYPKEAQQQGIQGRVAVLFTIDSEGHITDVRMRGPHALLENEVDRIISKLPQMTAGKHGGKNVNVSFSIPITFKLNEGMEGRASSHDDGPLEGTVPFAMIDAVPVFPGCEDVNDKKECFQEKIQQHISKHFRYPKEAQEQGIQGRVAVMFTINDQGNIVDLRMRGPHGLLENEVERIISKLPQMTPGRHKGKTVNVPFSIPVTFRLK
ncbi:MAG: TonB family protein [Flavobacteriaceae bacterium]